MPAVSSEMIDLVRKYARPGPRYTSYPPANRFVSQADHAALLEDHANSQSPLSLYFHIPFCHTLCWYCGCHTVITKKNSRADDYLKLVRREIELYQTRMKPGRIVEQIHLGGGTPNFLTPEQINELNTMIRDHFDIAQNAEISVELDPRGLSEPQVDAFKAAGFNRASFGVQDINHEVQKAINRIQPHHQNEQAIRWLREAGMHSLNIDLIYGLPKQTLDGFRDTITASIGLDPDRITLFSYAHVPWMKPSQKMFEKMGMPDAEEKIALFMQAIEQLSDAGYVYIGMDHFARADDELVKARENGTLQRNFQGYSTRAGLEILGMGISSISQTEGSYRQNLKDTKAYADILEAGQLPIDRGFVLSEDDKRRRTIIMELMCNLQLDYAKQSERWSIDIPKQYAQEIEALKTFAEDGLLTLCETGIRVHDLGRFFIRNIAMTFDGYLRDGEQGYSKTI